MTARCPHRRRRRHPCLPGGRHRAGPGVLGRVRHHRTDRRRRPRPAQTGVDPGLRRRWHPTRRCRRRRANQMGGPRGLAARPARHRLPGTPPPAPNCESPTSAATASPASSLTPAKANSPAGTPAPQPRPLRRQEPLRERHRHVKPALPRQCVQPPLVGDRPTRRGPARLDPGVVFDRKAPRRRTETAAAVPVRRRRPAHPHWPPGPSLPRQHLALDTRHQHRHAAPACPGPRLTNQSSTRPPPTPRTVGP